MLILIFHLLMLVLRRAVHAVPGMAMGGGRQAEHQRAPPVTCRAATATTATTVASVPLVVNRHAFDARIDEPLGVAGGQGFAMNTCWGCGEFIWVE